MKQEIQFFNIFACELEFGLNHKPVVVVAANTQEAKEVLEFYYDEPKILYLISTQELIDLLDKLETSTGDFYMVILVEETGKANTFTHHYEWGQSLESLEKVKYAGKDCLFLTRETTKTILEDTLAQFLVEPVENIDLQDYSDHRAEQKNHNAEAQNMDKHINRNTEDNMNNVSLSTNTSSKHKKIKILISDKFEV